jgi:hypothetical protein
MSPMPSDSVSAILINFQPMALPGPSVRLLKRTFYNSTGQKIYADSNAGCLTEGIQNIPVGMGACIRATSNSQKTCSVFI